MRGNGYILGFSLIILIGFIALVMVFPGKFSFTGYAVEGGDLKEGMNLFNVKDYKCENCNVFLIVIDALRADHLECYGYGRETAKNICSLADEGVLFENAIAQSSWTRPGVSSIITGLYPKNHGANTRNDSLNDSTMLISEILKDNGYYTSAFITNGNVGSGFGFNQGYDLFLDLFEDSNSPSIHAKANNVTLKVLNSLNYLTHNKLFTYAHYSDVHDPYTPSQRIFSSEKTKVYNSSEMAVLYKKINSSNKNEILRDLQDNYDDELYFTDKQIGNLILWMKEKGIYDNSIIIITADHGEEFWDHGGLKHGSTLYDELVKIPLIVKFPNSKELRVSEQVRQIDIAPTILDLLDLKENGMDGQSMFNYTSNFAISELTLDNRNFISSRTNNIKFILNKKTGDKMLFNLNTDRLEKTNGYSLMNDKPLGEKQVNDYISDYVKKETQNLPDLNDETLRSLKALGYLN